MSLDFKFDEILEIDFQPNWIETVGTNKEIGYGDTDSLYLIVNLYFDKFDDVSRTVNFSQEIAKRSNDNYLNILNDRLVKRAGLNPEYNLMNFKSEVVAYRGFFKGKKYYSLAVIWNEGNFYDNPVVKKTGGQIVKADSTEIIKDFLIKIYNYFVLNFDIKDEFTLYKKVFVDLKNQYINEIKNDINDFNIRKFSIPKKWGTKSFKVIPKQVLGGMLFNTIFENILRPGDSLFMVQIKIKSFKKISELVKTSEKDEASEYKLSPELVTDKLNVISVPYNFIDNTDNIERLKNKFLEYDIELDFDTITLFNINMKLDQFNNLFKEEIKRKIL